MNPNYYEKQKERALSRKMELIELRGGKCEMCGYAKNISALEFHHLNPDDKCFQLDSRHLSNTNKSKILEEVNKCILVCANCHRELHNPELNMGNMMKTLNEVKTKNSIYSKSKIGVCEQCGNKFKYVSGKRFCSKECRDKNFYSKYPSCEELFEKYSELKSWEKVAKHFGLTRKIVQGIRKKGL